MHDFMYYEYYNIFTGGAVISLMYQDIKSLCSGVSVHVAFGEVSKGKSNAVKIAIAACCNLYKSLFNVHDRKPSQIIFR